MLIEYLKCKFHPYAVPLVNLAAPENSHVEDIGANSIPHLKIRVHGVYQQKVAVESLFGYVLHLSQKSWNQQKRSVVLDIGPQIFVYLMVFS